MNKAHSGKVWENRPSDKSPINALSLNNLENAVDTIDDRVIALDIEKATKVEVATLVADVTFEESTGVITVTKKNGSKVVIDTQMEKIAVNFDYDPTTQQIILTLIDDTKQYIDLSALITQYEFLDTDTVAFAIGTDGKVSAIVKEGSIEEKHLRPDYLSDIKLESAKAQASQSAAEESAAKAESYAVGEENSAKYYYEKTKETIGGAVTGVKGSAETAYRTGNIDITPENIGAYAKENIDQMMKKVNLSYTEYLTAVMSDGVTLSAQNWTTVEYLKAVSESLDALVELLNAKQDASTAITTSNIGNQSVKYAEKAKCDGNGNEIIYNYMRSSEFGGTIAELKAYTNGSPCFCGSGNFSDGPAGNQWYNVMYIPHRNGIGGDSTVYGQLIMFPMTGAVGTVYIYTKQAGNWTAPQAYHAGDYLPLSGGTLTGDVSVPDNKALKAGNKVLIMTTEEGGNIAWQSPNGTKYEMDSFSNEFARIYSGDGDKHIFRLYANGRFDTFYLQSDNGALRDRTGDNRINSGTSGHRWKQVYAGAATISTSDRNLKKDIKELDESHLKFFLLLTAVSYQFIDGDSGRTHIGFIAQDVEGAMAQCGLTALDFAGFCKDVKVQTVPVEKEVELEDGTIKTYTDYVDEAVLDADGNPKYIYSLRYEEFIALVTYATQKLYKKVDEMEARMERMEDRLAALESNRRVV